MSNNRKTIIILIIFGIIFAIIGGTFAYYIWQSSEAQKTNVTFTATPNFSCSADGGGNITAEEGISLIPSTCENMNHVIKREIKVTTNLNSGVTSLNMDLWLNINSLGSYLENNANFKYALTTGSSSCTDNIVYTGNFNGLVTGNNAPLLPGKNYTSSKQETYYLWLWLDSAETEIPPVDETTRKFSLSLGGNCDNVPKPEEPVLDDGMIPVTISDTGVVTAVSKTDSSWYNYKNKEWANAVIVKSSGVKTREANKVAGTIIDSNDILAYYVWIPRYKYKIWTTSTSSTGQEQTIDILFEQKEDTMSLGTTVGSYRTHPAFWWDSNTNGTVDIDETLAGIWVGKFETSQGTESNAGVGNPTILPDVQSWRSQNVSTQFTTSLKFSGGTLSNGTVTYAGNDIYGLSNRTNSHMMKNSEWGAVAYLSHSKYGVNREVYINNSYGCYTGRSGGNVGGSTAINDVYTDQTATRQDNAYGYYTWNGYLLNFGTNTKSSTHNIEKVASTTGNITGIYDMSGGATEYVMGVMADSNGLPRSGYDLTTNSGFNGIVYDNGNNTEYTSGISFPTSNYYDLYTTTSSTTACNLGICYGHVLSETSGWYSDSRSTGHLNYPWFSNSGHYGGRSNAGIFSTGSSEGSAESSHSWRSVLAVW